MCGGSWSFLTVIQFSSQTAILLTARQNPCYSTITTGKFKLLMAYTSSDVSPRKGCALRELSAWPVTHLGTENIWVCYAPECPSRLPIPCLTSPLICHPVYLQTQRMKQTLILTPPHTVMPASDQCSSLHRSLSAEAPRSSENISGIRRLHFYFQYYQFARSVWASLLGSIPSSNIVGNLMTR